MKLRCYIFEYQSNENRAFRVFWDTRYRLDVPLSFSDCHVPYDAPGWTHLRLNQIVHSKARSGAHQRLAGPIYDSTRLHF